MGSRATQGVALLDTIDDNPIAVDDTTTVTEDSNATSLSVLANDTDPDSGPKSIDTVTQPAHGTVVKAGDSQSLTYKPNANYCNDPGAEPTDDFTYKLTPGGDEATVAVTVTCADDSPTAVDDTTTVTEDADATSLSVLANDTDPDSGPKSIDTVTQPAHGTVVKAGDSQSLTYKPNANYCNDPGSEPTDDFTYKLTPGGDEATVAVTVTCADDSPTAVDDTTTVTEDADATSLSVLANDTDSDSGPKSIDTVTQPAHGTVVKAGDSQSLTYKPNANYCNDPGSEPTDDFTYKLTPGGDEATVAVTVTCADDSPTAVDDTTTVTEDSDATTLSVLANDTDPDGGPKSIDSVTQPANGTVVSASDGSNLTYKPDADYCNDPGAEPTDDFTYTLTPGGDEATVAVTVTCADDNPVAVDDSVTVAEDSGGHQLQRPGQRHRPRRRAQGGRTVTQPATTALWRSPATPDPDLHPRPQLLQRPRSRAHCRLHLHGHGGDYGHGRGHRDLRRRQPPPPSTTPRRSPRTPGHHADVLANDTDPDAGPKSIDTVTQPAHGTVVKAGDAQTSPTSPTPTTATTPAPSPPTTSPTS